MQLLVKVDHYILINIQRVILPKAILLGQSQKILLIRQVDLFQSLRGEVGVKGDLAPPSNALANATREPPLRRGLDI